MQGWIHKVSHGARRGWAAWHNAVVLIIHIQRERGIAKDAFIVSGEEESIWVQATVQADRLQSHSERGDKQPVSFFHNSASKREANCATTFHGDLSAIGEADPGVGSGFK